MERTRRTILHPAADTGPIAGISPGSVILPVRRLRDGAGSGWPAPAKPGVPPRPCYDTCTPCRCRSPGAARAAASIAQADGHRGFVARTGSERRRHAHCSDPASRGICGLGAAESIFPLGRFDSSDTTFAPACDRLLKLGSRCRSLFYRRAGHKGTRLSQPITTLSRFGLARFIKAPVFTFNRKISGQFWPFTPTTRSGTHASSPPWNTTRRAWVDGGASTYGPEADCSGQGLYQARNGGLDRYHLPTFTVSSGGSSRSSVVSPFAAQAVKLRNAN